MRVGLVGCGQVGAKRARSLGEARLVAVADVDRERADRLAALHSGCRASTDWAELVAAPGVGVVIVATTNEVLAPVTLAAVQAGKHVLVEKPAARRLSELEPVRSAAARAGVVVKVGFNHRFHPGLRKAHELFAAKWGRPRSCRHSRMAGGRVGGAEASHR